MIRLAQANGMDISISLAIGKIYSKSLPLPETWCMPIFWIRFLKQPRDSLLPSQPLPTHIEKLHQYETSLGFVFFARQEYATNREFRLYAVVHSTNSVGLCIVSPLISTEHSRKKDSDWYCIIHRHPSVPWYLFSTWASRKYSRDLGLKTTR